MAFLTRLTRVVVNTILQTFNANFFYVNNVTIIAGKALTTYVDIHFSFRLISSNNALHFFTYGASVIML